MRAHALGLSEFVTRLGLVSLLLEKSGFDSVFEVAAGGGGGDGFEESEVVFSGELLLGEFLVGAVETFFGGERFGCDVFNCLRISSGFDERSGHERSCLRFAEAGREFFFIEVGIRNEFLIRS